MTDHNSTAPAEVLIGAFTVAVLIFGVLPEIVRALIQWGTM